MLETICFNAIEFCKTKKVISLPLLQCELNISFTEAKKCIAYLLDAKIIESVDKYDEYKVINKKNVSHLENHNISADKKSTIKNQGSTCSQSNRGNDTSICDDDILSEIISSTNKGNKDKTNKEGKEDKENKGNKKEVNFVDEPDTEEDWGYIENTIMECRHNWIIKKLINKKYGSNKNDIKMELDNQKNDINLVDLICKQLASQLKVNAENKVLTLKVERGEAIISIEIRKVGKYFTILDNGETVKFLKRINLINSEQHVKVIRKICDYYGVGIGEKKEEYTMYQIFTSEEKLLQQVYLFYSCIVWLLDRLE